MTKVAEEYSWAITEAVVRSCCGRSGSSVTEFLFQLDSLVYAYTHGVQLTLCALKFDLRRAFQKVPTAYVVECLYTLVSMSSSELDLENISLCNKECVRQPDDT